MLLSYPKVKGYVPIINEEVSRLCKTWAESGSTPREIRMDVHPMTMKVMVRLCFGSPIADDDPALLTFLEASSAVLKSINDGAWHVYV